MLNRLFSATSLGLLVMTFSITSLASENISANAPKSFLSNFDIEGNFSKASCETTINEEAEKWCNVRDLILFEKKSESINIVKWALPGKCIAKSSYYCYDSRSQEVIGQHNYKKQYKHDYSYDEQTVLIVQACTAAAGAYSSLNEACISNRVAPQVSFRCALEVGDYWKRRLATCLGMDGFYD